MSQKRYAVIGHPIGHTMSPFIHKRLFEMRDIDADYGVYDIPTEDLIGKIQELKSLDGFNITIPHKQAIIPFLKQMDQKASLYQSVNTVKNNGCLEGYTTDPDGFLSALGQAGIPLKGRVVILGTGGVARTIAYEATMAGCFVMLAVRRKSLSHAASLSGALRNDVHNGDTETCRLDCLSGHIDLLINATPVGMYPNTAASPVDLREFPQCEGVLDLIYNPARTALLQQAEALGIPCLGGLYMLAEQARCAAQIFTGEVIPAIRTKEAYHALSRRKENRILIGMPGCGKSTVGQALAQRLDRPFVDCDQELERILEMPVGEYITHYGEEAFRAQETALLTQLGKASGLVIATGGGCVTRPENYPHLHQNGAIIFLERELSKLPKKGRPLSLRGSLQDMYTIRLPMYRRFADITVANDGPAETVAQTVEEAYEHFSD